MHQHKVRWFHFRSFSYSQLTLAQNPCSMTKNHLKTSTVWTLEKFWSDANLEELSNPLEDYENTNLEEFLTACNERITSSLDKHAPLKILNRK